MAKSFSDGTGLRVTIDNMPDLRAAIKELLTSEVLVGIPEETTEREEADGTKSPVTSATLAYIHDHGAPEANIPQREFMIPGMATILPQATETLAKAAQYALTGNTGKVTEGFQRVGMIAADAIRAYINAGVSPPLSEYTLRKRAKKGRKGAQAELEARARGETPTLTNAKPLIDTGELYKSITYVIRKRSQRRK